MLKTNIDLRRLSHNTFNLLKGDQPHDIIFQNNITKLTENMWLQDR